MKLRTSITFFWLLLSFAAHAQIQSLNDIRVKPKNLSQRWELDTTAVRSTFLLTPYKPIYFLLGKYSSNPNDQPHSENNSPEYIVPEELPYDNIEFKFQLSFKTKVLQSFLWGSADLWVAYTQKSFWQLYNHELSRPFREINYEPEIILNFPVKFKVLGFNTRMVGIAFNHLSNGKSDPFSRSLNRFILHAGLERKNWTVYLRSWYGLSDNSGDNPDISDYTGRADLNVIYEKKGHIVSFLGGYNMNFNSTPRGYAEFSWSYPIKNNLKAYFQVSHGYGESLIDYNHLQTTVGVGISLVEWL
ncbi:phospholipase A [Flavobacterium aquicola]|uniref:Phosphatidylcholine 1-acylhydrolase n=1 Tax=Flavobacterium aquicola TaxID=1682742 RepID=A0A3E0ERN3_9FLAO|nr:phospholipase A [Flavobacterium aquicola]REH00883.1 phospholipase A1 [Flavobacterium aquicola]